MITASLGSASIIFTKPESIILIFAIIAILGLLAYGYYVSRIKKA